MTARSIARLGILTAAALILGYIERLFPVIPVSGVKLGLSNIVLIYAVLMLDKRCSTVLMLLKVGLSALLFSGAAACLYSLAGGVLSLAAMYIARDGLEAGETGVSVCGAVFHNMGQLAVACFFIAPRAALAYMPVLLLSGLGMGLLTGACARAVLSGRRFHERVRRSL